jgi:hypothetical protein
MSIPRQRRRRPVPAVCRPVATARAAASGVGDAGKGQQHEKREERHEHFKVVGADHLPEHGPHHAAHGARHDAFEDSQVAAELPDRHADQQPSDAAEDDAPKEVPAGSGPECRRDQSGHHAEAHAGHHAVHLVESRAQAIDIQDCAGECCRQQGEEQDKCGNRHSYPARREGAKNGTLRCAAGKAYTCLFPAEWAGNGRVRKRNYSSKRLNPSRSSTVMPPYSTRSRPAFSRVFRAWLARWRERPAR